MIESIESEIGGELPLQDGEQVSITETLSLDTLLLDTLPVVNQGSRAEDVLGFYTTLEKQPEQGRAAGSDTSFTTQPLFIAIEIFVFIAFCLVTFRYRSVINSLFDLFRGRTHAMKLMAEQGMFFDRSLVAMTLLGFLSLSLLVVRVAELYIAEQLVEAVSIKWREIFVDTLPLLLFIVLYGVWTVKNVMLKIANELLPNRALVTKLKRCRKLVFSLSSMLFTIPCLLLANAENGGFFIVSILLLVIMISSLVIYFMRTFLLFIEEKVSILYWILYLCIVEILPTSLLITSAINSI